VATIYISVTGSELVDGRLQHAHTNGQPLTNGDSHADTIGHGHRDTQPQRVAHADGHGEPGACNRDGGVSVYEILAMVNIELGFAQVADCEAADANHDGVVTIDEILTAVNNGLDGCVERP